MAFSVCICLSMRQNIVSYNRGIASVVTDRYFKNGMTKEERRMSDKTLALSNDKMIAGVCGGIADYFGWSSGGVRLAYVLLSVLSAAFPGLFIYIVLWLLMPKKDTI